MPWYKTMKKHKPTKEELIAETRLSSSVHFDTLMDQIQSLQLVIREFNKNTKMLAVAAAAQPKYSK